MTCDRTESMRDLFSAAIYDELDAAARQEFYHHVASCETCRHEYEELKETLSLMNLRTRVEPSEQEWIDFNRRLDHRLSEEMPPKPRVIQWPPSFSSSWGYGIAAVFLLAIGFFVGRTFFVDTGLIGTNGTQNDLAVNTDAVDTPDASGRPEETTETFSSTSPGPSGGAATREALDYLERSRNLLIGLTNLDDQQAGSLDLHRQQEVSRSLYNTGNTLTVALNKPSQQQLVQQLQIILLQLSNAGPSDGRPAVEIIRQGIDSRSILLKINLEAIRAALQESPVGATNKAKTNL